MAYLQSVNGYFKSRYAEYSPWNATVAMLYLYALGGLNFFLSPMHFLRVFNASDTAVSTLTSSRFYLCKSGQFMGTIFCDTGGSVLVSLRSEYLLIKNRALNGTLQNKH